MTFAGLRVTVVGLGTSGFAAARRLAALDSKVRVTESARSPEIEERAEMLRAEGIEVEIGGHNLDEIVGELAVVSPGIPPHAPVLRALERSGVEVISEIELAFRLARSSGNECEFLAVTGTNGKTTTTSLLAAMLVASGVPSVAAGNIGTPLVDAVFEVPSGGAIATEVSSFQLATIRAFRPRVAVLLNIAEDHTDWHGSFTAYLDAKARIVENQDSDDVFVVNASDDAAVWVARRAPSRVVPFAADSAPETGAGYRDGWLEHRGNRILPVGSIPLPGQAGREDTAAAVAAALEYGATLDAVAAAIAEFRPLAHRLAFVAEVDGVRYIDDSKATNPHATLGAVKGLRDVVLIAGGRSKGIDLSVLATTVPPVVAVVALGEAASEIERVFEGRVGVEVVTSMDDAVGAARLKAPPGGSVLLSPGCASLDMYSSYAERGNAFAAAVRALESRGVGSARPQNKTWRRNDQTKGRSDGGH